MKREYFQLLQDVGRPLCCVAVWVGTMVLTTGCFTTSQRINRYTASAKDRPASVIQALHEGNRAVPGMTAREVRLVLGSPSRITTPPPPATLVWHYDRRPMRKRVLLQESALWDLPVPQYSIYFDANRIVLNVIDHATVADAKSETPPPVPPTESASINPAESSSTRSPDQPVPRATVIPTYDPPAEEINVQNWPDITLQGISASSHAHRAVINGKVYERDEEILGGVRLLAIYANGVVLEYRQKRAFLRTGESIITDIPPDEK